MFIDIILIILITILLGAAFLFTVLPLLIPGIILTIVAALIYIAWQGLAALGIYNLIIILAMGLAYLAIDWFGGVLGAKKFGGSKFGAWGAIVGGILGIPFGGLVGVIVGIIIGAAVFEFIFDRAEAQKALKVGLGAGLGFLLGSVGKVIVVGIATVAFLWGVWR